MRGEVEEKLGSIERAILDFKESTNFREKAYECLRQLIVTGNCVFYIGDNGNCKLYTLNQYVIQRDPEGNLLDLIICEKIHPEGIQDKELREEIKAIAVPDSLDDSIELYTRVYREDGKWYYYQECEDQPVGEAEGTYEDEEMPFIVPRLIAVPNEDYGGSFIGEHLGDLEMLDNLSKVIEEYSIVASRIIYLVDQASGVDIKLLEQADSGAVLEGRAEGVSVLQLQKHLDMQIIGQHLPVLEQRLMKIFLLTEVIQRNQDRVTAEEVRTMVQALEASQGGAYSSLSKGWQLPDCNRYYYLLKRNKQVPELPKGVLKPKVSTGLEALGRGNDLDKLMTLLNVAVQAQQAPQELNKSDFFRRVSTALGIDSKGLIKTEAEMAQEMQQMASLQALNGALPGVATELTKQQGTQQIQE